MSEERVMLWMYAVLWGILLVIAYPVWCADASMFYGVWIPAAFIITFALVSLILRWSSPTGD